MGQVSHIPQGTDIWIHLIVGQRLGRPSYTCLCRDRVTTILRVFGLFGKASSHANGFGESLPLAVCYGLARPLPWV